MPVFCIIVSKTCKLNWKSKNVEHTFCWNAYDYCKFLSLSCSSQKRREWSAFESECCCMLCLYQSWRKISRRGYSIYPWVGRCGSAPHTLTLFKTKIADFPTLFKTEFRLSAGSLSSKNRVMGCCLTKDTLFKTKIDKINTLFKTKILKNIPWLAARPH